MRTLLPKLRRNLAFQVLILATLLPGLALLPTPLEANPRGPKVKHGNVNFKGLGTSKLDINSLSNRSVINWQSFSVKNGEITRINQPGRNSVSLNRVVTGNPSAIYGQLKSNGGVVLINPNGITVHSGGVVDVAGLLTMSTLDVNDNDFLDGGSMRFRGKTGAGIVVEEYGAVSSANSDVILLGNFLQNAGDVSAPDGNVVFGAGGDIIVDHTVSGGKISVLGGGAASGDREAEIVNTGTISGNAAELKASGNVYSLAIKNEGVIRANGYNFSGGKLTLRGGSRGSVVNTGQLYAQNRDGSGGRVEISGGRVSLTGGTVDASGANGAAGGSVSVAARDVEVSSSSIDVSGGTGGTVAITGRSSATLDATVDASGSVGNGGSVDMTAAEVNVGSSARVDVSGVAGGGDARFGGGVQGKADDIANADSTTVARGSAIIADSGEGDAGSVVIWADGSTLFQGHISAQAHGALGNGGFVEVSGLQNLSYDGTVSTASANGRTGRLLLDPTDVIIGPGAGTTLTDAALVAAVLNNNVVIHTASPGGAQGNISILSGSNISYDSPNSLAFFAHGSIFVDGDIKNHGTTDYIGGNTPDTGAPGSMVPSIDGDGTGNITLVAGWDPDANGANGAASFQFDPNNPGAASEGPVIWAQDVLDGIYGAWGQNEGSVFLNSGGIEPVEVGSARGETNAFGYDVTLRAGQGNERFTILGYRRENDLRGSAPTATGTINTATDLDFWDGVTGNINAHAVRDVILAPSTVASAEEGIKSNDRAWIMIGHGGNRENDNGMESRGGTDYGSDSGHISVGNGTNSGDITVSAGRSVNVISNRAEAFSAIGHGGMGHDDPDGNTGNAASHLFNPGTYFAQYGINGGVGLGTESERSIWGDMSGDITVTAGILNMEAGRYNAAHTRLGHGGERVRGVHSGDITVTTTLGGIKVEAAPDSASGGPTNSNDWRWFSNRDQSHAQVGHGGFDSDYGDGVILPRRNGVTLPTGGGGADVVINNTSVAGDGIRVNPVTGVAYGHSGDISVTSAGGIEFRAGNGTDAYAMLGHGGRSTQGDHRGDVTVIAQNGDIIFDRDAHQYNERAHDITNRGQRAHVQIGHGGTRYVGGSTGDIYVEAAGDIEFYAGRAESYAMVGHGGRGDDGSTWNNGRQRNNQANGTHSGDITVLAGGDMIFRSGFSPRGQAFSQIGHGGYHQIADVVDVGQGGVNGPLIGGGALTAADEGHNGDITVNAGGMISFKAGADSLREGQTYLETNAYDAWSVIGHGGLLSKGDHHGNIDITSGGDIEFEARGGWDAVTIIGGDNNDAPRFNSTEDNGRNGFRNWSGIGHGGVDSTHNNNSADNWNNSGKEGTGIGRAYDVNGDLIAGQDDGESHINVNAGGAFRLRAAMKDTAGIPLPLRLEDDNSFDPPGSGGVLNRGNIGAVPIEYIVYEPLFIGSLAIEGGGTSESIVITTEGRQSGFRFNDGGTSDLAFIQGNGTATLAQLVQDYNANIAGGQPNIQIRSGNANFVLGNGEVLTVTPYSTFNGRFDVEGVGPSDAVVIRADNLTTTAPITLTGDGMLTLAELITNWNTANPNDTIDLEVDTGSSTDSSIVANGFQIVIDGGVGPRPDHVGNPAYSRHYGRVTRAFRDNGEIWDMPDPIYSAEDSYVFVGHGGRSGDVRDGIDGTGHRGNITINAGGDINVEASDMQAAVWTGQEVSIRVLNYQGFNGENGQPVTDPNITGGIVGGEGYYNVGPGIGNDDAFFIPNANGNFDRGQMNDSSIGQRNYAHIGNGGWGARGDHSGNITITGGGNLTLFAGEGRYDYAQIGLGGFDADKSNAPSDIGNIGDVSVEVAGAITVRGGGKDDDIVGETGTSPGSINGGARDASLYSYAQIGHGGGANGSFHSGDVRVIAGTGIDARAGSSRIGNVQFGHGGYGARSHLLEGNITLATLNGDITLVGGQTVVDNFTDTTGNGLDNTGHISPGRDAFAIIGHGGFDADMQDASFNNAPGNGGFSGDITVIAANGSVNVQGGGDSSVVANNDNYRGLFSQIGHGGPFTDGDHTGNIRVAAGTDVNVRGGGASREAYGQIGHGGYDSDGNHAGTVDIDAGRDVVLVRGDGQFNPWAKIGHGAQAYGGRNNNGAGTRAGDITISAGRNYNSTGGLVGHVDPKNGGDLFAYESGDTFIAVSRNNRFAGGPGSFITDSNSVVASGGFGVGSELRIYMPDSSRNMIAEGTYFNSGEYTRTPAPGSNRGDEQLAADHAFGTGVEFGEPTGDFIPQGPYPTNAFGFYNIYYAGDAPPVDPLIPVDPVDPVIPFIPPFDFPAFLLSATDKYDGWDRYGAFLYFDGYDGQLYGLALQDAVADDSNPLYGGFFLENALDAAFGSRGAGLGEGNYGDVLAEADEEQLRKKLKGQRQVGRGGVTYYAFHYGTNPYSSFRVFGFNEAYLWLTQ